MPHFTIECSANVAEHHDIDRLVTAVHRAVLDMGIAPSPAALRTRAAVRDHYLVADRNDPAHGFVAITARIGPGRSAEMKQDIIQTVLDAAEAELAQADRLVIAWSMEVHEIDAQFRQNRNHIRAHIQEGER